MVEPGSSEGGRPEAEDERHASSRGLDQPGIRAFLIADIRGYTRFTDEHGDEAAAALADRFATLTDQVVRGHEGRVLELRGDEALAVFSSSRQALRAALALQAAFSDAPEAERLPVGIGLDAGEAVPIHGGFRGAPLNRAARLCSQATAGQVLVTTQIIHLAGHVEGVHTAPAGRFVLKGFHDPVDVVTITADPSPDQAGGPRPAPRRFLRLIPGRTRRGRLAMVVVVALVLLLGSAVLLPSLVPRAAESNADRNAPPALVATLVLTPDFQPREPDVYLVPDTASPPPHLARGPAAPPAFMRAGTDGYVRWHQRHGGVPLGQQTVRLVLTGRTAAPVLITRIEPFVVSREPPLRGWSVSQELGSGVPVHFVQASLDCPGHPATLITTRGVNQRVTSRKTALDLQVSRSDAEELELTVFSSRDYVHWGLAVTYVADGHLRTTRITDPRLRLTGQALGTVRTYTYFPSFQGDQTQPKRKGLVRTSQFDASRADLRFLHGLSSRLCR